MTDRDSDEGGPAFPVRIEDVVSVTYPGMTYRAWLVGQILPVLVCQRGSAEDEVGLAIVYADEVLKQLK